ncbi:MAG: hypothetical protein HQ579_06465, partial [Candidatus Omnitrophica bacterium]|nr:hypothetical protein [Candidatus Omnitrophota bacterium]
KRQLEGLGPKLEENEASKRYYLDRVLNEAIAHIEALEGEKTPIQEALLDILREVHDEKSVTIYEVEKKAKNISETHGVNEKELIDEFLAAITNARIDAIKAVYSLVKLLDEERANTFTLEEAISSNVHEIVSDSMLAYHTEKGPVAIINDTLEAYALYNLGGEELPDLSVEEGNLDAAINDFLRVRQTLEGAIEDTKLLQAFDMLFVFRLSYRQRIETQSRQQDSSLQKIIGIRDKLEGLLQGGGDGLQKVNDIISIAEEITGEDLSDTKLKQMVEKGEELRSALTQIEGVLDGDNNLDEILSLVETLTGKDLSDSKLNELQSIGNDLKGQISELQQFTSGERTPQEIMTIIEKISGKSLSDTKLQPLLDAKDRLLRLKQLLEGVQSEPGIQSIMALIEEATGEDLSDSKLNALLEAKERFTELTQLFDGSMRPLDKLALLESILMGQEDEEKKVDKYHAEVGVSGTARVPRRDIDTQLLVDYQRAGEKLVLAAKKAEAQSLTHIGYATIMKDVDILDRMGDIPNVYTPDSWQGQLLNIKETLYNSVSRDYTGRMQGLYEELAEASMEVGVEVPKDIETVDKLYDWIKSRLDYVSGEAAKETGVSMLDLTGLAAEDKLALLEGLSVFYRIGIDYDSVEGMGDLLWLLRINYIDIYDNFKKFEDELKDNHDEQYIKELQVKIEELDTQITQKDLEINRYVSEIGGAEDILVERLSGNLVMDMTHFDRSFRALDETKGAWAELMKALVSKAILETRKDDLTRMEEELKKSFKKPTKEETEEAKSKQEECKKDTKEFIDRVENAKDLEALNALVGDKAEEITLDSIESYRVYFTHELKDFGKYVRSLFVALLEKGIELITGEGTSLTDKDKLDELSMALRLYFSSMSTAEQDKLFNEHMIGEKNFENLNKEKKEWLLEFMKNAFPAATQQYEFLIYCDTIIDNDYEEIKDCNNLTTLHNWLRDFNNKTPGTFTGENARELSKKYDKILKVTEKETIKVLRDSTLVNDRVDHLFTIIEFLGYSAMPYHERGKNYGAWMNALNSALENTDKGPLSKETKEEIRKDALDRMNEVFAVDANKGDFKEFKKNTRNIIKKASTLEGLIVELDKISACETNQRPYHARDRDALVKFNKDVLELRQEAEKKTLDILEESPLSAIDESMLAQIGSVIAAMSYDRFPEEEKKEALYNWQETLLELVSKEASLKDIKESQRKMLSRKQSKTELLLRIINKADIEKDPSAKALDALTALLNNDFIFLSLAEMAEPNTTVEKLSGALRIFFKTSHLDEVSKDARETLKQEVLYIVLKTVKSDNSRAREDSRKQIKNVARDVEASMKTRARVLAEGIPEAEDILSEIGKEVESVKNLIAIIDSAFTSADIEAAAKGISPMPTEEKDRREAEVKATVLEAAELLQALEVQINGINADIPILAITDGELLSEIVSNVIVCERKIQGLPRQLLQGQKDYLKEQKMLKEKLKAIRKALTNNLISTVKNNKNATTDEKLNGFTSLVGDDIYKYKCGIGPDCSQIKGIAEALEGLDLNVDQQSRLKRLTNEAYKLRREYVIERINSIILSAGEQNSNETLEEKKAEYENLINEAQIEEGFKKAYYTSNELEIIEKKKEEAFRASEEAIVEKRRAFDIVTGSVKREDKDDQGLINYLELLNSENSFEKIDAAWQSILAKADSLLGALGTRAEQDEIIGITSEAFDSWIKAVSERVEKQKEFEASIEDLSSELDYLLITSNRVKKAFLIFSKKEVVGIEVKEFIDMLTDGTDDIAGLVNLENEYEEYFRKDDNYLEFSEKIMRLRRMIHRTAINTLSTKQLKEVNIEELTQLLDLLSAGLYENETWFYEERKEEWLSLLSRIAENSKNVLRKELSEKEQKYLNNLLNLINERFPERAVSEQVRKGDVQDIQDALKITSESLLGAGKELARLKKEEAGIRTRMAQKRRYQLDFEGTFSNMLIDFYFKLKITPTNKNDIERANFVEEFEAFKEELGIWASNYTAAVYFAEYVIAQSDLHVANAAKNRLSTEFEIALKKEDYEKASKLRDEIDEFEKEIIERVTEVGLIRSLIPEDALELLEGSIAEYRIDYTKPVDAIMAAELFESTLRQLNERDGISKNIEHKLISTLEKISQAGVEKVITDRGMVTVYIGSNASGSALKTLTPLIFGSFRGPNKKALAEATLDHIEDLNNLVDYESENTWKQTVARYRYDLSKVRGALLDADTDDVDYEDVRNHNAAAFDYIRGRLDMLAMGIDEGINGTIEDAKEAGETKKRIAELESQNLSPEDYETELKTLLINTYATPADIQSGASPIYSEWLSESITEIEYGRRDDGMEMHIINEHVQSISIAQSPEFASEVSVTGGRPSETQSVTAQARRLYEITNKENLKVALETSLRIGAIENNGNYGLAIYEGPQQVDTQLRLLVDIDNEKGRYSLEFPIHVSRNQNGEFEFTVGAGIRFDTDKGWTGEASVMYDGEEEHLSAYIGKDLKNARLGAGYKDKVGHFNLLWTPVGVLNMRTAVGVDAKYDFETGITDTRLRVDVDTGNVNIGLEQMLEDGRPTRTIGNVFLDSRFVRGELGVQHDHLTGETEGQIALDKLIDAFGGTLRFSGTAGYSTESGFGGGSAGTDYRSESGRWQASVGAEIEGEPDIGIGRVNVGIVKIGEKSRAEFRGGRNIPDGLWELDFEYTRQFGKRIGRNPYADGRRYTGRFVNPTWISDDQLRGDYRLMNFRRFTENFTDLYNRLSTAFGRQRAEYEPLHEWMRELNNLNKLLADWTIAVEEMQKERLKGLEGRAAWEERKKQTEKCLELLVGTDGQGGIRKALSDIKIAVEDQDLLEDFIREYASDYHDIMQIPVLIENVNQMVIEQSRAFAQYEIIEAQSNELVRSIAQDTSADIQSWTALVTASRQGWQGFESRVQAQYKEDERLISAAEQTASKWEENLAEDFLSQATEEMTGDEISALVRSIMEESLNSERGYLKSQFGTLSYTGNYEGEIEYWAKLIASGSLTREWVTERIRNYDFVGKTKLTDYLGIASLEAGYDQHARETVVVRFWAAACGLNEYGNDWVAGELENRATLKSTFREFYGVDFDPTNEVYKDKLALLSGMISFGNGTVTLSEFKDLMDTINANRSEIEDLIGEKNPLENTATGTNDTLTLIKWGLQAAAWKDKGYNPTVILQMMKILAGPYASILENNNLISGIEEMKELLSNPTSEESLVLQTYIAQIEDAAMLSGEAYSREFMEDFLKAQDTYDEKIKNLADSNPLETPYKYFGVLNAVQKEWVELGKPNIKDRIGEALDAMIYIKSRITSEAQTKFFEGQFDVTNSDHLDTLLYFALYQIESGKYRAEGLDGATLMEYMAN